MLEHSISATLPCFVAWTDVFTLCFSGGRFRGLQGAAAGAAVGAAVVFGREEFHKWRLSKGVQRYEAKYGEAPAVYHPTTAALVESQGPPRELAFPSLLPKSVKISEEEIEQRIVARMDELRQEMQEEAAKTQAKQTKPKQQAK
ncbi:unnamed protein product [Phytophthora lilii]|uniref:Unnamed protein product n=1 Tax=Phytophthora lilii TaxID=2077276 RepID=A0A9W6TCZ0_9STRA|nr:unnamed protein product [Phytophthora lilii]